jgi:chemotaxis protein MotA
MEKSIPAGLGLGFVLVFGTILMGDGWMTFLDPKSLLIVVGGTIAGIMVSFSFSEMAQMPGTLKKCMGFQDPDYAAVAAEVSDVARVVRREGVLALDQRIESIDEPILRSGLELIVDGIPRDEADVMLAAQVAEALRDRGLFANLLNKAGTYAPAFGMVGTLIGLIQMLQNLSDPTAIGPAMAVAMITTFYGALLANLVFLPLAAKVQGQAKSLQKQYHMVQSGVLDIIDGLAPSAVSHKLSLYVPASAKADLPAAA